MRPMEEKPRLEWGRNLPGELLEKWPKDESGAPVGAAFLTSSAQLDLADTVIRSLLEAYGIPCVIRYPNNGGFGNLMLGVSAEGVDIYVPETLLADAKNILEGEAQDDEEL